MDDHGTALSGFQQERSIVRNRRTRLGSTAAAILLALSLGRVVEAAVQLPPPVHPFDFGYYQIDGLWVASDPGGNSDYGSEVNCYTSSFYATRLDHGNVADWGGALSVSLERAVNAGKVVELALDLGKEPLGIAPGGGCPAVSSLPEQLVTVGQVLDRAAPFWDRVVRLELVDEPDWRTSQATNELEGQALAAEINCRVLKVQELLAAKGLAPRPIGITEQASWYANLPPNAMPGSALDWVGISAYLDSADDDLSLEALREKFNKRMAKAVKWSGGKPVVWVMQAYDLTHTWNNPASLVEIQRWTYELAATETVTSSDPAVGTQTFETQGLLLFSYGRVGGTRAYPALAAVHREMAAAIFGLPAPPTCGNPPSSGPSDLRITGAFGRYIDLAWLHGTLPANLYRIFQHNGSGEWHPGGDVPGSDSSATATVGLPGLPGVGLTRCFMIRGYYGDGHPKDTNEVCTTVFRDPPVAPPVPQSPAGCVNTQRPTLRWDPVSDATGYYVIVKRLADEAFVVNDPNVVDNVYPIAAGLDPGLRHAWKVKACNNQGCSPAYSPYVYFTPLCAPRADFNADGKNDLVFQDASTGAYSVWLMNGSQQVSAQPFVPSQPATAGWRLAGVNDFNRDTKPDLVWRNDTSGNLAFWLMDGVTRISGTTLTGIADPAWIVAGTGDFNRDGNADLLWRNQATGEMRAWYLSGTGLAGTASLSANVLGLEWSFVATADVNGDKRPDLLFQHGATGELRYQLLNGVTVFGEAAISPPAPVDLAWKPVAFFDLDRSGSADLLFQHPVSNRIVSWSMDGLGTTRVDGGYLSPDGSTTPSLTVVGPR